MKKIRLTEGDLHNIVKNSVRRILSEIDAKQNMGNEPVFPSNLLGTNISKKDPNAEDVFICGDYHGRYEDDDCEFLVYNLRTHSFRVLGWTTRGYCNGPSPFNTPLADINEASPQIQQEIFDAAIEKAHEKKDEIYNRIAGRLKMNFTKSYSQKTLKVALENIREHIDEFIDKAETIPQAISLIYNSPYSGFDTGKYFSQMMKHLEPYTKDIKASLNRKPSKIKLNGEDFTGEVVSARIIDTRFGPAGKVGIVPENGGKSIWAIINRNSLPRVGEVITLNGTIGNETDKSITLYSAKRIDDIDPERLVRL